MGIGFIDIDTAPAGTAPGPVATAVINGQTFLFAAAGFSGTISAFQVGADGSLTSVGAAVPGPAAISSMSVLTKGSQTFLYVTGYAGSQISAFNVGADGQLTSLGVAPVPFKPNSMTPVTVGAFTLMYVGSDEDDAITGFLVNPDGTLLPAPIGAVASATALTSAVVEGVTYVFSAGNDDDQVRVFKVNGISLAAVGSVADNATLELDGASALTTAVVGGTTFLFVGGTADDGISVFRVGAGGSLTNVDNVTDGESPALELDAVLSLTTTVIDGKTFLFAASQADDGVSVFLVGADGSLTNAGNVRDTNARELDGASGVVTALVGGETFLFASGMFDDGVSAFRLHENSGDDIYVVDSLADFVDETAGGGTDLVLSSISFNLSNPAQALGDIENLTLTGKAATKATGNALANIITGNDAANVLNGAAGVDTLVGGRGSDRYYVERTTDQVIEARGPAGGTADKVIFTGIKQTYTLASNVENLTLGGKASSKGIGNALNNDLIGNAARNVLNGMGGSDDLKGGRGNDVFEFTSEAHSGRRGRADKILDFDDRGNDRIDLSDVFGSRLKFIGERDFTKAGQVRIEDIRGADVIVEVNTGGSLAADMHIRLVRTAEASMTASDFVL